MHICELLGSRPTVSFEFFPPKTPEAESVLAQTLSELEPLNPTFVSVTYGAGGTTRDRTHDFVTRLLRESSLLPMAHLACAGHEREELVVILERYRAAGIDNILALRGDPPPELGLPPGDLRYASDLVGLCREVGDFCVAVAAHPEGHPQAESSALDETYQAAKLALADFAVTQFFFEPEVYARFMESMDARGVTTPVLPGIMPVTNRKQVARMAELSGAAFPAWLEDRLAGGGDDPDVVRRIGIDAATELCAALLELGAPGLHFYTMNRSTATREITSNLGLLGAHS